MPAPKRQPLSSRLSVEWLSADELHVDHSFQRDFEESRARAMAADFNPDAFGIPLVWACKEGGAERLYLVDGQHRHRAFVLALGAGQLMQCEVLRGATRAEAAKLFRLRNAGKAVRPFAKFRAGVVAGEAEPLEITRIVESLGLQVQAHSSNGGISCVSSLERVYRGDRRRGVTRPDALRQTLQLLLGAFGCTAEAVNGDLVKGVGLFVLRYGDAADYVVLRKRLSSMPGGASGLLAAGRAARQAVQGSVPNGVAFRCWVEYNIAARKHKLPDWFRGLDAEGVE